MKRLTYNFGLFICLAAVFFYGCDSDDDTTEYVKKATIKFEKTGDEPVVAYPGNTLDFAVNMTSTTGIKKAVALLDSREIPGSTKEYPENTESTAFTFSYTVKAEETGNTLNFVIQAYDQEDIKSTAEYIVYIQAPKPKIEIDIPDTAPASVTAGETITFDIDITSNAALKSIKTYLNGAELADLRKETFAEPNSDTYTFAYTSTDLDAGLTLPFVFEVMDANGGIVKAEYQVEVTRAAELDIHEFYTVLIGAQNSTAAGPFLNTTTGDVYVRAGSTAQAANIDLLLFYSNSTYGYYFVAPSDATIEAVFKTPDPITGWGTRHDTKLKFMTLTADEFLAINSSEMIEQIYTASSADEVGKLTQKLTVNAVVGFKTAAGKYGVIIVRSHASGSASGNVTVDIKVQK